jgi:hypothetical protein
MTKKPLMVAMLMAMAGTAIPALAQPAWAPGDAWNRDAFWRGAPTNVRERIDWLQRRIERGVTDGSLNRREARRLQWQLNNIRRDAWRARRDGGGLSGREEAMLQDRLDNLSRQIRWERRNNRVGAGGAYPPGHWDRYRTDYDAARYYREGPSYRERRLSRDDYVYRGSDGRYYCKRNDGTTGLIVGGIGGAALGNVIDGGGNRLAGTLIGGALGALAGQAIDQSNSDVRCR